MVQSERTSLQARCGRAPPIISTVAAAGTINPIKTILVGSQLSGQIVAILADYNDSVRSGQIVARLNSDRIRFKRDAARADLAQARATKAMQEAKAEEADLAFTRQAKLKPSGVVSEAPTMRLALQSPLRRLNSKSQRLD